MRPWGPVRLTVADAAASMRAASFHVSFLSCGAPRWKGPYPRSGGTTLLRVTTLLRATPLLRWNYPFHNVLNPIAAALLSGNAVVIKVSEHAAWSSRFYGKRTDACLPPPPEPKLKLEPELGPDPDPQLNPKPNPEPQLNPDPDPDPDP